MNLETEIMTASRVPRRSFVTLPEVARAKCVSRVSVWQAIRRGKLRAYRHPGHSQWMIHVDDARAYIERVSKVGRPPAGN